MINLNIMKELDAKTYELGYKLVNFNDWYKEIAFEYRCNSKFHIVEESFNRGIADRIMYDNYVNRICIFINDNDKINRDCLCRDVLWRLGKYTLQTYKSKDLNLLTYKYNAILIDNNVIPNLLIISDDCFCKPIKRKSDNPYWCGDYLIVISDESFEQWAYRCGIESEQMNIVKSRFFICSVDENPNKEDKLICNSLPLKSTKEKQVECIEKFKAFKDLWEENRNKYVAIDYKDICSNINDYIDYSDTKI